MTSWRLFMHSSDPLLSHAGAAGEIVIARIRLILTFALLVVPITTLFIEPWSSQYAIGLGVLICALAISAGVYALVRRGFTHMWLGVVSTAMDVTLVSAALITFLVLDEPNAAVNNRIIFDCYFIAIGVTCLRYDVRLCALAGMLAALQYLGIAIYADANWDPVAAIYQPESYGIFDWGTQLSRVVLLAMAAWLAATVVSRGQTLPALEHRPDDGGVQPRLLRRAAERRAEPRATPVRAARDRHARRGPLQEVQRQLRPRRGGRG